MLAHCSRCSDLTEKDLDGPPAGMASSLDFLALMAFRMARLTEGCARWTFRWSAGRLEVLMMDPTATLCSPVTPHFSRSLLDGMLPLTKHQTCMLVSDLHIDGQPDIRTCRYW